MTRRWNNGRNYSDSEIAMIVAAYSSNTDVKSGWLKELSIAINRPKENISRYARRHGLTDRSRSAPKKIYQCLLCGVDTITPKYCSKECSIVGNAADRKGKKLWANRPHPRGMLNKTHSEEYKKVLSERMRASWKDPNNIMNSKEYRQQLSNRQSKQMTERLANNPSSVYSRTQKGWHEFQSGKRHYFRSGWELRYANHLEMLLKGKAIKDWQYEPDTFWFEAIKRGVRSYMPDFKIFFHDGSIEYHEVKGWMDPKSVTKLKRMKKYYPDIKVVVIGEQEMKNI